MKKQKSFSYQFNQSISLENFFVNQTNFYAFNSLINNKTQNSFLFGPKKSGKSFLGQIWLNNNNAILLSNNFEFILSNKNNVLIDGIKLNQEEEIFHLINHCKLNNLKILILSDKKINDINFSFVDLPSRLKTFDYLEINQPDDEMLLTILTKLLIDKQFIINSNEIFEYILRRVDRTYEAINEIVSKLDIISLEKKRQLTIPLIKEIL